MAINVFRLCTDHLNARICSLSLVRSLARKHDPPTLPPPPKKPINSFLLFLKDFRQEVLNSQPGLLQKDISKELGTRWKNLDSGTREKYHEKWEDLKSEYEKTNAAYLRKLTDEQRHLLAEQQQNKVKLTNRNLANKKYKELNGPKRALTPYVMYVQSHMKDRGSVQPREYMKDLSVKWGKLMPEEKEVYVKQSEDDRERYQREFDAWTKKLILDGKRDIVDELFPASKKR